MRIRQTVALKAYPADKRAAILETFFEAQTRVNMAFLLANPEIPRLYESGVRYRREGSPEVWKDIPTILRDGADDCEGLSCWLAAEFRVRNDVPGAAVRLAKQRTPGLWHAIVIDVENPRRRWDPSKRLGMKPRRMRRRAA